VLDGAVLVVFAVEGMQPHTRLLMKSLRSLRLPTLVFANKVDRMGARVGGLVDDIVRLLTPALVPMGTVRDPGTAGAQVRAYGSGSTEAAAAWAPVLAENDDAVLAAVVDDVAPATARLRAALREQTAAGLVHPLLFGSALTGAGVPELVAAIGRLLPPAPPPEPALRARVFAIERAGSAEKTAYVRSYGGDLRPRQRVTVYRREPDGRAGSYRAQVSRLEVAGAPTERRLTAGHIAKVHGLTAVRIGDQIGSAAGLDRRTQFAPPSLETVVRPREAGPAEALHTALVRLADEDPLIRTRVTADGETSVLLYGEVQKELIAATVMESHGVDAMFSPSRVMHLERPVGVGRAVEELGRDFLATVGLRVESGDGVRYRIEIERGVLPLAFHRAIEKAVLRSLEQGAYGWPVTDVTVTLTRSGFKPETAAGDFRLVTPYVLMRALAAAGTRVYEPCHRFEVETPADRLGAVTTQLAHAGGRIDGTDEAGGDTRRVTGRIPAREVYGFQQRLPGLSNGEGLWSSAPSGDRLVAGPVPRRPRTDGNPFDRTEYLRFLAQRTLAATSPS
jgi:ribosomal protection tetracycline resistance protein